MYESWTRKSASFSVMLTSSKKCKIVRETGCTVLGTTLDYRLLHAKLTKFMNWQIFFPKWSIFSESCGIYLLSLAVLLSSYLSLLIFEKGVSCFGTLLFESIHLTWSINRYVGSSKLFHFPCVRNIHTWSNLSLVLKISL